MADKTARILEGDSVIVDDDRSTVAIVEGRDGTTLRLRFPYDDSRTEYVARNRLRSVADVIATARRKGVKYSNSLTLTSGASTLADLVAEFGYRAEVRLRKTTFERVERQMYRAGLRIVVDGDIITRDAGFWLEPIERGAEVAATPSVITPVAQQPSQVALPDPFWPAALGVAQSDELRFVHSLSQSEPILAMLMLPERAGRLPWLRPTWEGLLSWAYTAAQQFVRRTEPRIADNDAISLAPVSALHQYAKAGSLPDESRLRDGPHHLNLVTVDASFDGRELPRIKALWPGAVFTFDPQWLSEAESALYDAPNFKRIVETLFLLGGRVPPSQVLRDVSPLRLLVWAKESSRQILARATVSFGDFITSTRTERFRGSNESSTALALKAIAASWAKRVHPAAAIAFEQADEDAQNEDGERVRRTRADVCVKGVGVFEIETMNGSGPIEDFYRRKVFSRLGKLDGSFNLVVPNEALLWAGPYLTDLAARLSVYKNSSVLLPVLEGLDDSDGNLSLMPLSGRKLDQYRFQTADPLETSVEMRTAEAAKEDRTLTLEDIAGYSDIRQLLNDEVIWALRNRLAHGTSRSAGILFFGPPGCGKSHIARALCGELNSEARLLGPSDLKGLYLGWGQARIREQFEWLFDDENRILMIDEFDAIARSRQTEEMHSDEKADVNELLVQLDKAGRLGRLVLCTTNFVHSLDEAVLRSGRFGHYVPVEPPDAESAASIVAYYLRMIGKDRDGAPLPNVRVEVPSDDTIRQIVADAFANRRDGDGAFCNADLQELVNKTYRARAREEQRKRPGNDTSVLTVAISAADLRQSFSRARRSISLDSLSRFLDDVRHYSTREMFERHSARWAGYLQHT